MALKIPAGPLRLGSGGGLQIKQSSGPSLVPATVAAISGYKEWYDPSQLVGADSSAVSTFAGRAGFLTVTQATGAKQPLLRTGANGINGQKVLQFTAASAQDLSSAPTTWGAAQTGFTFIAVAKLATVQSFPEVMVWGAARYELRYNSNTGKPQWVADSTAGATTGVIDGAARTGAAVVLTGWFDDATDTGQLWVNGTSVGTYSETHAIRTASDTFFIGSRGSLYFDGLIGDCLVFTKGIATADRQYVERGLGAKFGITVA